MKKVALLLILLAPVFYALPAAASQADSLSRPRLKFIYDVDFEYALDNAEFDYSNGYYEESSTLHAIRLIPGLGLWIDQNEKIRHTLFGSLQVYHDFGKPGFDIMKLVNSMNLYYRIDAQLGNGQFSGIAGWFPRRFMEGEYIGAFFSPRNVFEDNSLEGLFLKYRTPKLYAELGLDWLGLKMGQSRERFRILTAGEYKFPYGLSACWAASFYHFACSETANNVVDNHMLHLYAKWSPEGLPLQQLDVTLGAIATYQWDRAVRDSRTFPFGFQTDQTARKWDAGIHNSFYLGQDLMPFFGVSDYGTPYARDLYFGEIFYHTHIKGFSFYDRLEAFYEPHIFPWLDLKVAIVLHFGNPTQFYSAFRGWQQMLGLRFNLDKLLRK